MEKIRLPLWEMRTITDDKTNKYTEKGKLIKTQTLISKVRHSFKSLSQQSDWINKYAFNNVYNKQLTIFMKLK